MSEDYEPQVRSIDDMPADNRRGGDVRTLLSPKTAGTSSGFMGVATIAPGDWIAEHYHPYSEEFVYVVSGTLVAELDGGADRREVPARNGLFVPINLKHRLRNEGDEDAFIVFHLLHFTTRQLDPAGWAHRTDAAGRYDIYGNVAASFRICARASSPMTRWKSRTIMG